MSDSTLPDFLLRRSQALERLTPARSGDEVKKPFEVGERRAWRHAPGLVVMCLAIQRASMAISRNIPVGETQKPQK